MQQLATSQPIPAKPKSHTANPNRKPKALKPQQVSSVPIHLSQADMRLTLETYGADEIEITTINSIGHVKVGFVKDGYRILHLRPLNLPSAEEKRYTHDKRGWLLSAKERLAAKRQYERDREAQERLVWARVVKHIVDTISETEDNGVTTMAAWFPDIMVPDPQRPGQYGRMIEIYGPLIQNQLAPPSSEVTGEYRELPPPTKLSTGEYL